jgi:hypothetical protein
MATASSLAPFNERDVHPLAESWKARVRLVNFDRSQEEKLWHAIHLIQRVIRSSEFRNRVLNYEYKGRKSFVDSDGLTNDAIYNKIFDGAETIGGMPGDNGMDVELELYHQATNTIGYTYPTAQRIWINKKYFTKYTPVKVADNLMHEWMHKLGFTHDANWSPDRDHSVPYAVGYRIRKIGQNFL